MPVLGSVARVLLIQKAKVVLVLPAGPASGAELRSEAAEPRRPNGIPSNSREEVGAASEWQGNAA